MRTVHTIASPNSGHRREGGVHTASKSDGSTYKTGVAHPRGVLRSRTKIQAARMTTRGKTLFGICIFCV
jgi:hypothetical protein